MTGMAFASAAHSAAPAAYPNITYDPAKDFAPIALVSNAPFLLLVHPSQPVHSVADLIALAKAKPGQLSYGSAGPGSPICT